MEIYIIDSYEFVYNIAQYFGAVGVDCDVVRNDKLRSVFFDGASGFVQAGAGIVYEYLMHNPSMMRLNVNLVPCF